MRLVPSKSVKHKSKSQMDFFWLLEKGKKTVNKIYSKVTHMESQVLPHT